MNMLIKFKKLDPSAYEPAYAKVGDAGLDLRAITKKYVEQLSHSTAHLDPDIYSRVVKYVEYGTGLAFEIPDGHVGLIFPRSSISNVSLMLTNHVGVIDSGFRGEIRFRFKFVGSGTVEYAIGDKIGQLIIMPYPTITLQEVTQLSETSRGVNGFGSSGK